MKKHWFLIVGIMLLSNYCIGQSFLTIPDGSEKPNGRPFIVRLNPTSSIAQECTSQTITLNIGALTYLPGSNGPLPAGIVITPVVTGDLTVLTISGILNDGKQGSSLTMDIAMQFKPGTCDGVFQKIVGTTTNIGCIVASDQIGDATVSSRTPNNVEISMYSSKYVSEPICPRKILSYRINVSNDGNQGFNINNAKLNIELDKCAQLVGVYKPYTYVSVNPVVTYVNGKQVIVVDNPDLELGPYTYTTSYDLYYMYPCLNGNENDCTSGLKDMTVFLTGTQKDCGVAMITDKIKTTVETTVSTNYCGDVSCATGGSVGELDSIYLNASINLPCPTCAKNDPVLAVVMYVPPLHPDYPDRVVLIDIPVEANVTSAFANELTPCGTAYTVTYINAQGTRQSTPFPGSLNRKVEFKTNCAISAPSTYFFFYLKYNEFTAPDQYLAFKLNFTSGGTKIYEGQTGSSVQSCIPSLSVYNQVRKASQIVYENNFNASAIPGELMTYRHELYNYGMGDTNNSVNIKLDENLIYEGDFRYAYQTNNVNNSSQLTPLAGKNSFTVGDLGTVAVSTPAIGATGGTINLSGFNYPCTNNHLFIEFNVRPKNNVFAGNKLPVTTTVLGSRTIVPQPNIITIAAYTYVKSKMFVKCALANEWNDSGINVKNGEAVDFKMQFSNAGSTPVVLSELINLRPQAGDLFEFGSNSRNSTLNINYNCEKPSVFTNNAITPSVNFFYAQNSVTMDRNMLCPPQSSGNTPNWIPACTNANWLKAEFSNNFTLLPGDYVDVIYKGTISDSIGTAYNSFAFKVGGCSIVSANSNTLAIVSDNTGIGCNSCTLTNPYSADMRKLFENLLKNVITRKINGETDAQINGSNPAELAAIKLYLTNGGGDKIYNFTSTLNAQNKITSIKFSFSANSENDVTFLEEKGLNYNPEVGSVDPSYLKIDTTLYAGPNQYLTTCRKTLDENGLVISDCNSNTQVKHIDFCPSRFCYPMNGEIKTGE